MRLLDIDPDRAYYGYQHILYALQNQAIETLLITDELFRSSNITVRKQYVTLVDQIKTNGGIVIIFSIMNPSGQQLQQISGIAAILRFPLPDLLEYETTHYDDTNHDPNYGYNEEMPLPNIDFPEYNEDDDDDDDNDNDDDDHDNPHRRILEDMHDMGF
jgi:protein pelota